MNEIDTGIRNTVKRYSEQPKAIPTCGVRFCVHRFWRSLTWIEHDRTRFHISALAAPADSPHLHQDIGTEEVVL